MILVPKGNNKINLWFIKCIIAIHVDGGLKHRDQRGFMVGPIRWPRLITLTAPITRPVGLTIIMTKSTPESDDQRSRDAYFETVDSVSI
ncbi:hypothetical protein FCV25MIE_20186 [Fagus crenata]|jgi:hypothetical protein